MQLQAAVLIYRIHQFQTYYSMEVQFFLDLKGIGH